MASERLRSAIHISMINRQFWEKPFSLFHRRCNSARKLL